MAETTNLDPPPHTVQDNQLETGIDRTVEAETVKYLKGSVGQLCGFQGSNDFLGHRGITSKIDVFYQN